MKDTRALQMRELARDIKTLAAELLDEGVADPQEMLHVAAIHQLAADAAKRADVLYEAVLCGSQYGFSAVCGLVAGHDGKHRHHGVEWSDAESATSQAAIAKKIGGN